MNSPNSNFVITKINLHLVLFYYLILLRPELIIMRLSNECVIAVIYSQATLSIIRESINSEDDQIVLNFAYHHLVPTIIKAAQSV